MRILSIGHSEFGGGAQTVFRISNQISDDKIQVITAFEPSQHSSPDIEINTLKKYKNPLRKVLGYFIIPKNNRNLKNFLIENKVDIIHLHNATTIGLSTLLVLKKYKNQAKIIFTSHGYGLTCPIYSNFNFSKQEVCNKCAINSEFQVFIGSCDRRGRIYSIIRFLDFKFKKIITNKYKLYDVIIVPSEYLKNTLVNSKYNFKKIEVVPNPIVNDVLYNTSKKKKNIFTFIGRFSEEKNVLLLIEAFSKLTEKYSEIQLNILGDGEEKHKYLKRIKELNLEKCVFVSEEFLNPSELRRKLEESKFLVLPTKSPETFGLAIYEGILMGNIPIVANIGAQADNLKKIGFGYIFENNNLDALVAAMENVFINYEKDVPELNRILPTIKYEYSKESYKKRLLEVYEGSKNGDI